MAGRPVSTLCRRLRIRLCPDATLYPDVDPRPAVRRRPHRCRVDAEPGDSLGRCIGVGGGAAGASGVAENEILDVVRPTLGLDLP